MSDLTGQYLGQYQILARVSKGSTSTIYKAYQPKLDRYVAIKVLSPHVVDEEGFLERFTQEARAVAQLDHPNIVPVYDFDREGDTAYIVMKYVESGTLRSMMTGAPLELGLAVDVLTQVGLALGYAHRRGVIHRDVKPSNILIGEGRWALLTDFGLAKMLEGERHITRSGIGLGTPDYMSPEQAQGMPGDGRADLYSLGVTLYEMVTGRPPFQADGLMGVVVKHITEPPLPPRQLNPSLPEALESAILTALAKDPADRFQSAEAMVAAVVRGAGPVVEREAMAHVDLAAISVTRPTEPVTPLPITARNLSKLSWLVRVMVGGITLAVVGLSTLFIQLTLERPVGRVAVSLLATQTLSLPTTTATPVTPTPAPSPTKVLPSTTPSPAPPTNTPSPAPPPTTPSPAPPTDTPSPAPPTDTPTPAPPTSTPTPAPPTDTPSPTPEWTYLPSSYPIQPGIYVKVVRPAGFDVLAEPGFDQEFITTIAVDKVIYVLDGPRPIKSLWWIKVTDGITTGWGVRDNVVAYGVKRNTP